MRPVSVSGLAAFSEMVVFSTRPTVCLLSGTMLPAKLVISSTELASMTCWRLLFGNFQPFCFDSFAPTSVFFFTCLLVSLTLCTSSFMDWPSDLICVFEASLALQLSMQHWSVNWCCCNNRLQAPLSLIPSTSQGVVKTITEVAQLG